MLRIRRWVLAVSIAAGLVATGAAYADVVPPPPPPPPPGGGGDAASPARSSTGGGEAVASAALCLAGSGMLQNAGASPQNQTLWGIGCAAGAFANPGVAVIGGAGALALFAPPEGLFVKLFRPGGFRCQPGDLVPGCKEWLEKNPVNKAGRPKKP